MTSTANGNAGQSFGWINRDLFESGVLSDHINVFGGEERFWLGPEGGQYSIFFKGGDPFDLEHWHTPRLIDLDTFSRVKKTDREVEFIKQASLTNYAGFTFDLSIRRSISILSPEEVFDNLHIDSRDDISCVGYQTVNTLTNTGNSDWEKETGLLSIWLLGMFNPSPETTIIIPFVAGSEKDLGAVVNDTYFGKVPEDRLIVKENAMFFRGDGQWRSKIGLSPSRAKDVMGAYDAKSGILTIVKYNKPDGQLDYVNSLWEIQKEPYLGDVINSYNDGAPEPGTKPLGPFYELETSSPALALKMGQTGTHISQTYHFEGTIETLDDVSVAIFGVSLHKLTSLWN
jgi:hypothetical protein